MRKGSTGSVAAIPYLVEALAAESAAVRCAAAGALGRIGGESCSPFPATKTQAFAARACWALREISRPELLPSLARAGINNPPKRPAAGCDFCNSSALRLLQPKLTDKSVWIVSYCRQGVLALCAGHALPAQPLGFRMECHRKEARHREE